MAPLSSRRSRVLVIRGGAIGDFILTLPAIRLIRDSIPGCHLEVLGYPGIADLAVKAGLADAVRSLEHRTMAPLFAKGAPIDAEVAAYLGGFNLVVSYLYDPDGLFRSSLERAGVKTLIECSHRVVPGQGHAALQLVKPLERLAMFLEDPNPRLFPADRLKPALPQRSEGRSAPPDDQPMRIAIHPGSGSVTKNWPLEHWMNLVREIRAAYPEAALCLITGEAEAERGMVALVREAAAVLGYECWHGLPLAVLADNLASCDVFLGHDSGISHLAAACGLPCQLLLFGPTDPETWAPANPAVAVIRAQDGDLKRLSYQEVRTTVLKILHDRSVDSQPCDHPGTC